MAAMKAGWAFVLCRFLVGFAEGPFLPIVSLITSSWCTKEETPLKWQSGTPETLVCHVFLVFSPPASN
jgi:MFS family permease